MELERQRKPTLVVSHLVNLEVSGNELLLYHGVCGVISKVSRHALSVSSQVLYAYLLGRRLSEDFESNIPLHVVVKLAPTQYGWKEERFDLRDGQQLPSSPAAAGHASSE